jgi:hypothetical protein
MMPQYHALVSVLVSAVFFYFTSSPLAALLCFLAGVVIDADHLLDFWIYKSRVIVTREIFAHFYNQFGKIYVILHSYEIIIALLLFGCIFHKVMIHLFAIAIGMLIHIILDFFSYEMHPASYFFTYRLLRKFDKKFICLNEMKE